MKTLKFVTANLPILVSLTENYKANIDYLLKSAT